MIRSFQIISTKDEKKNRHIQHVKRRIRVEPFLAFFDDDFFLRFFLTEFTGQELFCSSGALLGWRIMSSYFRYVMRRFLATSVALY